jgi:hypothetical protein
LMMNPIRHLYDWSDAPNYTPHDPRYPTLGDHPNNYERERAMIENLLAFWDAKAPKTAAILNTGSAHSRRIGNGLRERGINYYWISQPP